jgi:type II secretion system protein I
MCRWIGSPAGSASTRIRLSSGESGFTLLEVLVAFAVLAVMIVPILQVFGGGLGMTESARAHTTAALLARSKLAEVGVLGMLAEGETTGSFEVPGYSWRQSIALDISEVIPPDLQGVDELIEAGAADRISKRQRRRESSGFGQGRSGSGVRQGRASSRGGGIAGREANLGGLPADDLLPYQVTVTVEWTNFRGRGALTLSSVRLGRQPNNLGTRVR